MGIVIRQSFKATIVSYAGAGIGAVSVLLIYPRCLDPEQIGLIRILTEAALLIAAFAQLGMAQVSIKFFPYFKNKEKNHNGFPFLMAFVPMVGFLLFLLLFRFIKESIVSTFSERSALFGEYIIYLIPLTLFSIYTSVYETYSSLLERIVVPKFIKEILVRLMTITIIILFFLKIITLNQFILLFVCVYGVATVLIILYVNTQHRIRLKPQLGFLKKGLRSDMLKFMLFMISVGVGTSISGKIDVFMISQKISLAGTGIFTIAFFMASFIEMPSRAISQITIPFVSKALKENDMPRVNMLYKRVSINQLTIAGLLFCLIWINADNFFKIMPNGEIYQTAKYVILFIGVAKLFDAVTGINSAILGYSKYYYYSLLFIFVLAIISVINNLLFIPIYGVVGAAIATAVSIFLFNALMVLFVWWKLKIQPFSWSTLKSLLAIALVLILNLLLKELANPWIDAMVRSTLSIVLFVGVVYFLKASDDLNDLAENAVARLRNRKR
jgi:O-antigen/teichoic acid export membrane protein